MRFFYLLFLPVLTLSNFTLRAQTETRTAQTIAFPALAPRTYGSPPVSLTATASSGLPVAYAVVSGHGRITGATLEIQGGGPIIVEATQNGNGTYAPAAPARQTLTVEPIQVRIVVPTETAIFTGTGTPLRAAITTDPPVGSELYADPSLFVYYGDQLTSPVQLGSDRSGAYQYPYAVGRYVVRATIMSPLNRYAGSATGALEITRAPVTLTLGNLSQTADGQPKAVSVTTNPVTHRQTPERSVPMSSVVRVTYNGSTIAPSAPGSYQVVATVDTESYTGSASGTLLIAGTAPPPATTPPTPPPPTGATPVAQTIAFSSIGERRFGAAPFPLAATATSGLPVSYAVESGPAAVSGATLTLTGAGAVTIVASQPGNSSYLPAQARQTFTVAPASANVVIENLIQTADGTPRSPTITSTPAGLAVRLTYNGNAMPPTTTGAYEVVATITDPNYAGAASATFTLIPLTPTGNPSAPPARLANVSTRGRAGSAAEPLIAGFVITGSAPKQVLVRGAGPALRAFGVADAVARARLQLYRGPELVADNQQWSAAASDATGIRAAGRAAGAFDFAAGSDDAALVLTLPPGAYTAVVTNADATPGSALAEVYDVSGSDGRLINLSTRATLRGAGDALIAGLVVSGPSPRRVLLRAVGPTLGSLGVSDPMADPQLELYRGDAVLSSNRGWNSAADLREAAASVGAFALGNASRDAALFLALEPGAYTVHVKSSGSQSGTVLLEAYEVP